MWPKFAAADNRTMFWTMVTNDSVKNYIKGQKCKAGAMLSQSEGRVYGRELTTPFNAPNSIDKFTPYTYLTKLSAMAKAFTTFKLTQKWSLCYLLGSSTRWTLSTSPATA